MKTARLGVMLAVIVMTGGCGEKPPPPIVPVSGVLTLGGKPLGKAEIRCYPEHPGLKGDYIAMAVTDDEGRFTLETNGQQGACACLHSITVNEGPPPKEARANNQEAQRIAAEYAAKLKNRPIPQDYSVLGKSQLSMTFTAEQSEYKIELKR